MASSTLGSAVPLVDEVRAEVRGRDLVSGLPRRLVISSSEVREAIVEPVASIVDTVKSTLDRTPPELAADIMENGIVLAGGGALLVGLRELVEAETGMPVRLAPDPHLAVVLGAGRALEEFDLYGELILSAGFE